MSSAPRQGLYVSGYGVFAIHGWPDVLVVAIFKDKP
jgi:hypothetical protein